MRPLSALAIAAFVTLLSSLLALAGPTIARNVTLA